MTRKLSSITAAIAVAAMFVACAEQPTTPSANSLDVAGARATAPNKTRPALLTNLPVAGALSDGGTFTGTFTATRMAVDPATRALTMWGTLSGTATLANGTTRAITGTLVSATALLERADAVSGMVRPVATCDILFLDLGPIFLDLLGLTLDLSQITLDLNAVSGAGNLLGNLLCGLVGILDLPGVISSIINIIDRINNILDGLGTNGVGLPAMNVDPAGNVTYNVFA